MKLSIVTVTLNSKKTIISTLNSILSQTYKDIEHIIVDGGSDDGTLQIVNEYEHYNKKVIVAKGSGIYKAMNLGIKMAKGDLITILNSDDIYQNENTIAEVIEFISKHPNISIFLGDVVYFKNTSFFNIYRYYRAKYFKRWQLKIGLMPPHPPSFIRKNIYNKYGLYHENFLIASDFEIFLRLIYKFKVNFKILNKTVVRMRMGGISGKNFKSYIISTKEILKSFELNKINTNFFKIILRLPPKIGQYFLFNKLKLNNNFRLFKIKFGEKYLDNSFKIVKSPNKIPYKENFILSGLNLAFLGYYFKGEIPYFKNIIHWPDGVFAKTIFDRIIKIPGRLIMKEMTLPKEIKRIVVLGNLSVKNYDYLKNKFKIKIDHFNLPYGSFEEIKKNLDFKFNENDIVFLTLPTPKQEQIAIELAKKNNYFKIICIGASISIASGEEKSVPKIFENFEFLWRLRTEPFRRIKRLFVSLFYFLKGKYLQKKLDYLNIYSVD